MLSLDSLKREIKEQTGELDTRLNTLIREDRISVPMSISLMNDSGYAYDVAKDLLKMGEILFSRGESRLREAERSISLDESEVEEALLEPKDQELRNTK